MGGATILELLVSNSAPAHDGTFLLDVRRDGSASASWLRGIDGPRAPLRDAADAVHALCLVHAVQPALLDLANAQLAAALPPPWLERAAIGFAIERSAMALLVAAVGPIPSTPGQADADMAFRAQRRALAHLVGSDRTGCALGAAAAFVVEWTTIRGFLELTAERVGTTMPLSRLPDPTEVATAIAGLPAIPSVARAFRFGVDQLLAQHRGMWDLLEARAAARRDS